MKTEIYRQINYFLLSSDSTSEITFQYHFLIQDGELRIRYIIDTLQVIRHEIVNDPTFPHGKRYMYLHFS